MHLQHSKLNWAIAVTAAAVLVIAAGATGVAVHDAAGPDDGTAPGISAAGFTGPYNIGLTLSPATRGQRVARVEVSTGSRRLTRAAVSLGIPSRARASQAWYQARPVTHGYEVALPIPSSGPWKVNISLKGTGIDHRRVLSFLVFVSPAPSASGYAELLVGPSTLTSPASFAIGPYVAEFVTLPAGISENAFRLLLHARRQGRSNPPAVRLGLTMLEMDMGRIDSVLKPGSGRLYAGRAGLPMAGPWEARVSVGPYTAKVALWLNGAGQSSGTAVRGPGFQPAAFATGLPYQGFVTEMRAGRLARLNNGVAPAGQTPHGVDFVPRERYAVVTDMGGDEVRLIDIRTGATNAIIPVGLAPAHVVFSKNGAKAFVTDFLSSDVAVIDVPRRRLITRVTVGLNPHGLDITPDGRFVYVACAHGGGVYVLSAATNQVVATIPTGLEPYGLTMGPPGSGKAYVSDAAMNQVDVISLAKKQVVKRIPVGKSPALMVAASNGSLYVANHGSASVTAVRMNTGRVVATIPVGSGPHGLDATPDGKYVYVANNNSNTVSIISTSAGRVVKTVRVPGEPNEVALRQADDLSP